jgi:hypothetical protein
MSTAEDSELPMEVGLLLAFYALEAAGLSFALALYKYHDRLAMLRPTQTAWLVASLLMLMASAGYIVHRYRRARRSGSKPFYFTLATNLIVVVLLAGIGEAAVRLFAQRSPLGLTFAGTLLLPKSWPETTRRNRDLLQAAPKLAYFVEDSLLGWTVGDSRTGLGGMYQSSVEGIRSARAGIAYADNRAPHRIATVGDSFTFGLEGPFEDSWGFKLGDALGPSSVVLNFGVDGFGVDQAYLRYLRDVRPWHPQVTIFGFILHDLTRSLSVYTFITFPEWGYPFSKPRFRIVGETPELMNVPLISPGAIIRQRAVSELPFIEYDPGYDPAQWQPRFYYASYLVRFVLSRFPHYPPVKPEASDETLRRLNTALLLEFTRTATAEGTIPIVAYYPGRSDFNGEDTSAKDSVLAALGRAGVRTLDLTSCVRQVGPERAFIPGSHHYAAAGNAAVARCLLPVVQRELAGAAAH